MAAHLIHLGQLGSVGERERSQETHIFLPLPLCNKETRLSATLFAPSDQVSPFKTDWAEEANLKGGENVEISLLSCSVPSKTLSEDVLKSRNGTFFCFLFLFGSLLFPRQNCSHLSSCQWETKIEEAPSCPAPPTPISLSLQIGAPPPQIACLLGGFCVNSKSLFSFPYPSLLLLLSLGGRRYGIHQQKRM